MQKCDLISAKKIYKDVFVDQENSPLPARLKLWNTDQQSNNFKGILNDRGSFDQNSFDQNCVLSLD